MSNGKQQDNSATYRSRHIGVTLSNGQQLEQPQRIERYIECKPRGLSVPELFCNEEVNRTIFVYLQDGLVGVRDLLLKKPLVAKSFYNGYLSKPHLKYTRFSNELNLEHSTTPPKVISWEKHSEMQKYWHKQLLRMASKSGNG